MLFEKIIKRNDGSQAKIAIKLFIFTSDPIAQHTVFHKEKGKRTWHLPFNKESQTFRGLKLADRQALSQEYYLKVVSAEEIETAKKEAILSLTDAFSNALSESNY